MSITWDGDQFVEGERNKKEKERKERKRRKKREREGEERERERGRKGSRRSDDRNLVNQEVKFVYSMRTTGLRSKR